MTDMVYGAAPENVQLAKRRVPCMVAYLHPFRLVNGPNSESWEPTISDINTSSWDYVALHEMVGGVDVGLPAPYHMVVARDGALGLPVLPQYRSDQMAVEFFNRCLAACLLGGIYCEAIALDGLAFGSIIDWKYVRVSQPGNSYANHFHHLARHRSMSPLESISLMTPRVITLAELREAIERGHKKLAGIPELSGEFLLKGVTGIARRDWGAALTNIWIAVEQVTSNLWTKHMLQSIETGEIPGRSDQLADGRSWTIAVRHEVLNRLGVISTETLGHLSVARKARNALAHAGKHPTRETSLAAYFALLALIKLAAGCDKLGLEGVDLNDHSLSDPFAPKDFRPISPEYWMEIPKLPGEVELEQLEAKDWRQPRRKKQT